MSCTLDGRKRHLTCARMDLADAMHEDGYWSWCRPDYEATGPLQKHCAASWFGPGWFSSSLAFGTNESLNRPGPHRVSTCSSTQVSVPAGTI